VSTFSVVCDTSGLDALIDDMADKADAAARPAAQAGAQVFYDDVRRRVPVSRKGHWFHGTSFKLNGTKYWFDAGSLRDAVYQVFSKDNSGQGFATYHVAWNHQKVPYGFMVEFGTSKAPAHPFLRPAIAKAGQVQAAMLARFVAELKADGVIS
jgi:HK97 gp10 family phage protein